MQKGKEKEKENPKSILLSNTAARIYKKQYIEVAFGMTIRLALQLCII